MKTAELALALALLIPSGCGPASEASSLRLFVDDAGAWIGTSASSSAAGVDVELEWAMQLENRGSQPCAVAVYRWDDALPEAATLPSTAQSWPGTWDGGERVASGVVEPDARLLFGPESLEPDVQVDALFGVAACAGAELELDVRAEVFADLGVRSISEALILDLWRAG